MKKNIKTLYLPALILLLAFLNLQFTGTGREKKQQLFNGKNFEGWRGINKTTLPEKGWTVDKNAIKCTGEKGGDIVTVEKYGNFDLTWEWKMQETGANSGIKYMVNENPGETGGYGFGIEYQKIGRAHV